MSVDLVKTVDAIRRRLQSARLSGKIIGLVPTMGALHRGHFRLIKEARQDCHCVVVSIFANPHQFGPGEDFEHYPATLESDLAHCEELSVDVVFAPRVEEMYPREQLTFVEVAKLGDYLCGPHRPGHFKGVATVVLKLFNILQPDRAYFGEKDAQQLAIVRRMVQDLNIPVDIVSVSTVRESDGLAISSRNQYLGLKERQRVPVLYRALQIAKEQIQAGETGSQHILRKALRVLEEEPLVEVEYLDVVDPEQMQPVSKVVGPVRVCAAIRIGSARLIDNILCERE
ncbi:pantoate--beta-alanine ligase [Acidobacteria bacterium AH-259-A15]|nr:pantoate--beta-alanine ligase [Acidobacteria bacterium AH-259-A15]